MSSRRRPDFVTDQRAEILRLLRAAGAQGVSKEVLLFQKHFSQSAARVWELEKCGYVIRHEARPGERYVRFVLVSEPAEPKPLPDYKPKSSGDWFQRATGRPRPKASATIADLPLFSDANSDRARDIR